MTIRLLESARDDLRAGWNFYEKISPGLGGYFLDRLEEDIDSLGAHAGIHEVVSGYHRMLAKRFPFAIYYRLNQGIVDVYAVLDCRRDPTWIASRLSSDG